LPLITREVRWFFDGGLDATGAAVADWFAGGGAFIRPQDIRRQDWRPEESRTDRYLRLPDADDVGVKLRQGRLELKGCHSRVGIQQFGDGAEGEVSCWTKWAVEAPHGKGGIGIEAAFETLSIAKRRVQRIVRFSQEGIVEVPAGQEVEHGMHMELTRLSVAGAAEETHWSLGFEAFPDGPSCCAWFAPAVTRLLAGWPAEPLRAENSMSYPRWLQWLAAGALSRSA
jgi:hypothetical protein